MNEFHAFVPHDGDHLAVAITVPDHDPSGLVALFTGTGAPRSHRYQLFTRVARRLTEDAGLAVVRMDYRGIGDSTGTLRRVVMRQPRVDQARSVVAFARQALGVDRVAMVGHCSGSLVALGLAAETPHTLACMCILPRLLEPSAVNRAVINARRSRLAAFVRRHRPLDRLARHVRGRKGKGATGLMEPFTRTLERGRLLFVYSDHDTDAWNDRSKQHLQQMRARLPQPLQARFELQVLPEGPLAGYEAVSIQDTIIDAIADWIPGCFEGVPERTPQPAAPTAGRQLDSA
jgi:pimeloyl-ACP methyl ester carboxylesterase